MPRSLSVKISTFRFPRPDCFRITADTDFPSTVNSAGIRPSLVSEVVFPRSDVTATEPLNGVLFVPEIRILYVVLIGSPTELFAIGDAIKVVPAETISQALLIICLDDENNFIKYRRCAVFHWNQYSLERMFLHGTISSDRSSMPKSIVSIRMMSGVDGDSYYPFFRVAL